MAYTRSMAANKTSKRKLYRQRLKSSPCRKLITAKCRHKTGCKYAMGRKRSFCRRSKNTRS